MFYWDITHLLFWKRQSLCLRGHQLYDHRSHFQRREPTQQFPTKVPASSLSVHASHVGATSHDAAQPGTKTVRCAGDEASRAGKLVHRADCFFSVSVWYGVRLNNIPPAGTSCRLTVETTTQATVRTEDNTRTCFAGFGYKRQEVFGRIKALLPRQAFEDGVFVGFWQA